MKNTQHSINSLVETIGDAGEAAETKCRLAFGQVTALGVIAAAYLALSTTLSIAVGAGIESPGLQKAAMGAVFPVGLIAVLVAISELSTGNYLVTPLGAMTLRVSWKHVLWNWAGSYAGNFLGAFLLAAIVIYGAHVFVGPMWGEQWVNLLRKIVSAKASLSPMEAFWRSVLCIWLVDLAVWQAYRVKDNTAKFLFIWFPAFAFFTLGLEHSVVNMFLFPAAIFAGVHIPWSQFLLNNLTPVVLGNVVGGLFIMGIMYWYSAGMPTIKHSIGVSTQSKPQWEVDGHRKQGSHSLLGENLLKAVAITVVFIALFPGVAAGLSLLLPQELGIIIPMVIIIYLLAVAFAFSVAFRKVDAEEIGTVAESQAVSGRQDMFGDLAGNAGQQMHSTRASN